MKTLAGFSCGSSKIQVIIVNVVSAFLLLLLGACGSTNYSQTKQANPTTNLTSDLDKRYLRASKFSSYKDSKDRRKLFWIHKSPICLGICKIFKRSRHLEQEATFAGISHGCTGMTPSRIKYMEKVLSEWRELAC